MPAAAAGLDSTMDTIAVDPRAIAIMLDEARAAFPEECCGLLLGSGTGIERAVPARNIHVSPRTHFEIDPAALIDASRAAREHGPQVLGYYHSHPAGSPAPSVTDRAAAAGDGAVWAIIAGEQVAFWRDEPDGFMPIASLEPLPSSDGLG